MAPLISLGPDAWITVAVVVGLVGALMADLGRPDLVLLSGLAALLVTGVVPPAEAFAGFSNPAVLTVGALYVVAGGVQQTSALSRLDRVLFPDTTRLGPVLARFMVPTSVLSGLLNNTPIVAMLTPRLQEWADAQDIPASKLMIPLSYAAITGGMMTLVGTSTNLIVAGLMEAEGYDPLSLFDVTWVGVPAALVVIAYFVLGGHRLLPDRGTSAPAAERRLGQNMFEVTVTAPSPIVGKTVAEAGLRDLGDAYLTHVRRGTEVLQGRPGRPLEQGDVLAFNGSLAARERLLERPGLSRTLPHPDGTHDDPARYETLPLYEAVIAESSNLVGTTLGEANFREQYQGVVLGIQRQDEPVTSPVGTTELQAGDLLIVEAPGDFEERWSSGSREEFYLVAPRDGRARQGGSPEHDDEEMDRSGRAPIALGLTGTMVLAAATGLAPIVTAAFLAALLMILAGCIRPAEAQRALNVQVLVVIAAALGIGKAIETTGLATATAQGVLSVAEPFGPVAVLVALYLLTNLLTEIITNNAAAVLMLPVAMAAASSLGAPPVAFGVLVAVAASASFLTPIGYQTNLMVMAPGGYRFSDYARVGWPVTLLVMGTSVSIISLVWL
ncbi:SLC13 family permease [Salinibacter ruber]|uniref:Di/tricarboxylate transporter n=1 Tax=Salinibacter ruber TaxID=146919 RepID=A0A9X2UMH0_9BACT|nr:di/tricarboxylate transporter [Salinibacter ruber]MCS3616256.1 di/tricarboxylate transporter [Salinibacter ruber]MCS3675614.1 di/tricarboxylate transporter [Salinibacter ruber]MCS3783557.1 di/tricarboxylate transporter [Salinibacter ruber]MCS4037581.1 di/tricarboxylate transporter [Salinibacter ruber]